MKTPEKPKTPFDVMWKDGVNPTCVSCPLYVRGETRMSLRETDGKARVHSTGLCHARKPYHAVDETTDWCAVHPEVSARTAFMVAKIIDRLHAADAGRSPLVRGDASLLT